MSDKKQYISIHPPFTVDKHLDNASGARANGSFVILKNYIPDRDILRAREGITTLSYTPSATDVSDGIS